MREELLLGHTTDGKHPVHFPEALRRRGSGLVIGSPGLGKSKFFEWFVRSLIERREGVIVLDPHGELFDNLTDWCAYNAYGKSRGVIRIDPSRGDSVVGINPFRPKPGIALDVQVDASVAALLRVWGAGSTNETPTLDRILRCLFAAMIVKRIPLHDASKLIDFTNHRFRQEVIESIDDPFVRATWEDIQSLERRREWKEEFLSTQNRLCRLVSSPTVRRFVGMNDDERNLDIFDALQTGKTVLVNVRPSGTLSDATSKVIGALFLSELVLVVKSFRGHGGKERHATLVLDEWTKMAVGHDVERLLSEGRKFGVSLLLASQGLSQVATELGDDFVNTLLTCTPLKVVFGGLARQDARLIAEEIFTHQINFHEVKDEVVSTKFRPVQGRALSFTQTKTSSQTEGTSEGVSENVSHATMIGTTHTTTEGRSEHSGTSQGETAEGESNDAGMVVTEGESTSTAEAFGSSETESVTFGEGSTQGRNSANTSGTSFSVSSVPVTKHEEFRETSSRQFFSLEDQLWRLVDGLKDQPQRHAIIKIPGRPAIQVTTPFVEESWVSKARGRTFIARTAERNGAKTPEEVDVILEEQARLSGALPEPEDDHDDDNDIWRERS